MGRTGLLGGLCALLLACAAPRAQQHPDTTALEATVTATEQAFARTLAQRDFAAFQSFLAPDAVFFSGPQPLRGGAAVSAYWKQYFDGPQAPFSWQPDVVRVLASGDLALSSGPVRGPAGEPAGRFNSIWRRDAGGQWRIVFDKGEAPCRCAATP